MLHVDNGPTDDHVMPGTVGRFKEENGLRIAAIHQTGALADWNKEHPDRQAWHIWIWTESMFRSGF